MAEVDYSQISSQTWNDMWNQTWNTYYNKGWNYEYGNMSPAFTGEFGSAMNEGYRRGLDDRIAADTSSQSDGGDVLGDNTGTPTPPEGGSTDALFAEIDRVYNETMGRAGEKQSLAEQQKGQYETEVGGQFEAAKKSAEVEKVASERGISESEAESGTVLQNALTAGRNLYNELKTSGQQRWGQSSSAGQAFGELTGREFQRGQAKAYEAYQTAKTKITNLKANLNERFDAAMQNLEQQKITALGEVRRWFQDKMDEIEDIRSSAVQNKSQARLDALQALRNQVYEINLSTAQTEATLKQQQQQQQAELDRLESQLLAGTQTAQQTTAGQAIKSPSNVSTAYNVAPGASPGTSTYTGIAYKPRREEEIYV